MKSLLLIDIQNDFLPGGALAVAEGDEVVPFANRLMGDYELVVATQDWHPADHKSFASQHAGKSVGDLIELDGLQQILWPDHCLQHTSGSELPAALNKDNIHHIIYKGTDPLVDSYSGFFDNARRKSTGLDEFLRSRDVDEVHIIGLATDYCVKFTALDAVDLGYRTVVFADGVRGVDLSAGDCQTALQQMSEVGVDVR